MLMLPKELCEVANIASREVTRCIRAKREGIETTALLMPVVVSQVLPSWRSLLSARRRALRWRTAVGTDRESFEALSALERLENEWRMRARARESAVRRSRERLRIRWER